MGHFGINVFVGPAIETTDQHQRRTDWGDVIPFLVVGMENQNNNKKLNVSGWTCRIKLGSIVSSDKLGVCGRKCSFHGFTFTQAACKSQMSCGDSEKMYSRSSAKGILIDRARSAHVCSKQWQTWGWIFAISVTNVTEPNATSPRAGSGKCDLLAGAAVCWVKVE